MVKKKAAVKTCGTNKSILGIVDAAKITYEYATAPYGDLPFDSTASVTVGGFTTGGMYNKGKISVSSTTYSITAFGFIVEDYNVSPGSLPIVLDFTLDVSSNDKVGSLNLKTYPGNGKKLRVTILTKKVPKGGELVRVKRPKKSKKKSAASTKKK
jgi:hypothetical protein